MKSILLFIQGGGGHSVHDEWDNQLVESLGEKLGPAYTIRYPRMPNEDDPEFASWQKTIRDEFETLDDTAVLAGHSIGATILLHTLADHPPTRPPAGIFLISMPFIGSGGWPSDEIPSDTELGTKLPARVPVYLYQGGADETVPVTHVKLYAEAIPQAIVRSLPGRDHQLDNDMSEVAADIRALSR
jgi:hypothetical protein